MRLVHLMALLLAAAALAASAEDTQLYCWGEWKGDECNGT